jgi:hypothetical protein
MKIWAIFSISLRYVRNMYMTRDILGVVPLVVGFVIAVSVERSQDRHH